MDTRFSIEERVSPEITVLTAKTKDSLFSMGRCIKGPYGQAKVRGLAPFGALFCLYFEKPEGKADLESEMCLPAEGPSEELDKLADIGGDNCLYMRVKGSCRQFPAAY